MILIVTNTDVVHQIQRIEVTTELMILVTEAHQRHVELPARPGYWLHVHADDLFIIGGPAGALVTAAVVTDQDGADQAAETLRWTLPPYPPPLPWLLVRQEDALSHDPEAADWLEDALVRTCATREVGADGPADRTRAA